MTKKAKKPLQIAQVVKVKLGVVLGGHKKTVITFFLLLTLVILLNIHKYMILKVYLEPFSRSEINWVAEDGLWFGGTYSDSNGDGTVIIRLPLSTSLLTIGREFNGSPNIVMIGYQNRLLREMMPFQCSIILANNNTPLLNHCWTSNAQQDQDIIHIVAGEVSNISGISSRNVSALLGNSSSLRSVSIEFLDFVLAEDIPLFSGEGRIIGYDLLFFQWSIFQTEHFVD